MRLTLKHWPAAVLPRDSSTCLSSDVPREWKPKSLSPVQLFAIPWSLQSMESPGQNTGVGSLSLLQGIFPTQGWNPGLPYCRRILYQLSHEGSPRILEWVAYSFSSGSSQPRNWTRVPCIAGEFFTIWAVTEALMCQGQNLFCRRRVGCFGEGCLELLSTVTPLVCCRLISPLES